MSNEPEKTDPQKPKRVPRSDGAKSSSDRAASPSSGEPPSRPARVPQRNSADNDAIGPPPVPRDADAALPESPSQASSDGIARTPAHKAHDDAGDGPAPTGPAPTASGNPPESVVVEDAGASGTFFVFTAVPSWLTSMMFHVVLLLALTMLTFPEIIREPEEELVIGTPEENIEDLDEFLADSLDSFDVDSIDVADDPVVSEALDIPQEQSFELPAETSLTPAALNIVDPLGMAMASPETLMERQMVAEQSALDGRTTDSRAKMVREGGGTKGSEAAVAKALQWIAEHQMPDGGWMIDHTKSVCQGRCSQPGTKDARFGATGLALLPFLGAGNTHQEGEYKKVVSSGLKFLLNNMEVIGKRGRLVDEGGNYYSHGLCTIALCEAYAMTRDRELMLPAQLLVNETVFAQDPVGGGWRYTPQQPGDTSAVGWQLMALKSAHMAYLQVPKMTIRKTSMFLDSVQGENGAKYGYQDPGNRRGTTSVGLLCRMYLGWKREFRPLQEGVAFLGKNGPSKTDIYMNYYATQVMRHYGGEAWEKWNKRMRTFLVESQSVKGHENGSWMFESGSHHIQAGGRLYCTSLATMILEVYYRHMPLYQTEATEEEFPL